MASVEINLTKFKHSTRLRSLLPAIYVVVLITLSIFAKDNLIAEFRHLFLFDRSPRSTTIRAMGTIEVVFSPNNGATATIIRALAEARKSILVSAYSFTSKDIAKALLDAKKRNVAVKLILDKSQISQRYSSSTFFANQGFDLRIDVKHAIYHNKVMIIDDNTVITGSFNFTKAAETKNAENVLIIRDNSPLAHLYTQDWWFHWNQSISLEEFLTKKLKHKV
jgi:phosphatidylserine/phosphatidylglycerophosphate/cardiolipin synthase-like enzyme